jgi:hypothetical protein
VRGCFKTLHLFHVHSLSQRHTVSKGSGGLWKLEFLQLCSEWLADLQTLCSFSRYPFFFFASSSAASLPFLFLILFFWIAFQAPLQKPGGSQRILAHCSPGMLLFLFLCRIDFFLIASSNFCVIFDCLFWPRFELY